MPWGKGAIIGRVTLAPAWLTMVMNHGWKMTSSGIAASLAVVLFAKTLPITRMHLGRRALTMKAKLVSDSRSD